MRVLIDLLHPAHVHVFRAIGAELEKRGHEVMFTARDKDVTLDLLEAFNIPATVLSRQRSGVVGLAGEMAARTARLAGVARRWRPDVLLGIMGPSIAVVGRLLRIPAVVMYDTEIASITNRWVFPLATHVLTPDSYEGEVKGSHVTYPSYHELAYLHPNRFRPDPAAVAEFGLSADEPYSVMRFVSWEASHDIGDSGIDPASRLRLIRGMEEFGRVVVSSEGSLEPEFRKYALHGPVSKIHHLLAFAQVVIGDSATMTSEAALLGTPAINLADYRLGYLNSLQRYGLLALAGKNDVAVALDLLNSGWPREVASSNRHAVLLRDRSDATEWIVNWLENAYATGR